MVSGGRRGGRLCKKASNGRPARAGGQGRTCETNAPHPTQQKRRHPPPCGTRFWPKQPLPKCRGPKRQRGHTQQTQTTATAEVPHPPTPRRGLPPNRGRNVAPGLADQDRQGGKTPEWVRATGQWGTSGGECWLVGGPGDTCVSGASGLLLGDGGRGGWLCCRGRCCLCGGRAARGGVGQAGLPGTMHGGDQLRPTRHPLPPPPQLLHPPMASWHAIHATECNAYAPLPQKSDEKAPAERNNN